MEAVQEEAARSLADMARDASRRPHNGAGHQMAVEVRDDTGPVLQAKFTFQIERSSTKASSLEDAEKVSQFALIPLC